ncbi:cytochrome P450 [Streptomyces sp. NPDC091377]|uniref:cytochrome P450 n=1 Tax=Streptomyces sp. NPDC091377 TaxID=3365995 RepID=UPI0038037B7D
MTTDTHEAVVGTALETWFFSEEGLTDPYAYARVARAHARVAPVPAFGLHLVTGFTEALEALTDPTFRVALPADHDRDIPGWRGSPALAALNASVLMVNPPEHTRLRKAAVRFFTPRRTALLENMVERIVTGAVDRLARELAEHGVADFQRTVGFAVPAEVIGALLGVGPGDLLDVCHDVETVTKLTEPFKNPELIAAGDSAYAALTGCFEEIVRARRDRPRDDIPSALLTCDLSSREVVDSLVFLFCAGYETTSGLLGNGMLALLDHPGQYRRLAADPALATDAVEEMLRYDSPVQFTVRYPTTAVRLGDTDLAEGATVLVAVGAANRDPAQFPAPERFDIGRGAAAVRNLSFGGGPHNCVGAHLARLEARILFQTLPARLPGLRATGRLTRRAAIDLRNLLTLEVTDTAPAGEPV